MFELWIWDKNNIGPRKIAQFKTKKQAHSWISKMLDMNIVKNYALSKVESFSYGGK